MFTQALKFWLVILSITPFFSDAQDFTLREMVNEPIPNCDSLETHSLEQIYELSFFAHEDSINGIINELEQKCGLMESIHRVRLLYKIADQQLEAEDIAPYYRDMSDIYLQKLEGLNSNIEFIHPDFRDAYKAQKDFMLWTQVVADSLSQSPGNKPEEKFFLELYTAEDFYQLKYNWYQNQSFDSIPLAKAYREEIFEHETSGDRFLLEAGAWQPMGNLKQYLGRSFLVGVDIRHLLNEKFGVGIAAQFRFPRNQEDIEVAVPDTTVFAQSKFAASLYFNGVYKMLPKRKLDINLVLGGGIDIMTTNAVRGYTEEGEKLYVNLLSYDLVSGVEFSLPIMSFDRIGFRVLHHWVDFNIDNALHSPLHGNFVTFTCFYRL